MSVSGLPFDDIRALLTDLPDGDAIALKQAAERNKLIADVFGSIGTRDAEIMEWLAEWSGKSPAVTRPLMALFAGTHKVAEQVDGLQELETLDLVTHLSAGGAPINQICASNDIGLKIFDLALQYPVEDISKQDALDEKGAAATIGFGMEAIAGGVDILGLSAFGKGSEIANLALLKILFGHVTDDAIFLIVEEVVEFHQVAKEEPLELLRRIGGREYSALAGAILAARTNHIPVVLSGASAFVVAALLEKQKAGSCDHCIFAGPIPIQFNETALQFKTILSDASDLMDGSAAALAIALIKSQAAIHSNVVLSV